MVGGGIEQKAKRTHRHGQQCGDCWAIRGLNGNGKNTIKIKLKSKISRNKFNQGGETIIH